MTPDHWHTNDGDQIYRNGKRVSGSAVVMRIHDLQRQAKGSDVVAFLERPDIRVTSWRTGEMIVHHENWRFEACGSNVIVAARAAILAESKYLAAKKTEESNS